MLDDKILSNELYEFAAASLTANFQLINPDGFSSAVKIIKFINNSTIPVIISYDGVTAHDYIREDSDVDINLTLSSFLGSLINKTMVWFKYPPIALPPKKGSIYVTGIIKNN